MELKFGKQIIYNNNNYESIILLKMRWRRRFRLRWRRFRFLCLHSPRRRPPHSHHRHSPRLHFRRLAPWRHEIHQEKAPNWSLRWTRESWIRQIRPPSQALRSYHSLHRLSLFHLQTPYRWHYANYSHNTRSPGFSQLTDSISKKSQAIYICNH